MPKQITACTGGAGWVWVAATSSPHPHASCSRSHLLSEKGVLLLSGPSSLNARPTLAGSLPAGRQYHHSAASSSARLNTGAKVHTAAGPGEGHTRAHTPAQGCTLGRKRKQATSHTSFLSLNCPISLSLTHRSLARHWASVVVGTGQSWCRHGGSLGGATQTSLTLRLTPSQQDAFARLLPLSFVRMHFQLL